MADITSSIQTAATTALTLSNLVLVTPQKNIGYLPTQQGSQSLNVPTLMFHYEGENTVQIDSDITDHYVEDNTAIADNIALKPEIITVNGFIGELNNVTPDELVAIKIATEKLLVISAYTPELSATGQLLYNQAEQAYRLAQTIKNNAVSSWNSVANRTPRSTAGQVNQIGSSGIITNNGAQTLQQKMYQQFYGYWRNRALFKVQTPWAIFNNCAILGVQAIQDDTTRMITSFTVRFKLIRVAKTQRDNLAFDSSNSQGRAVNQGAPLVDLGTQTPLQSIGLPAVLP